MTATVKHTVKIGDVFLIPLAHSEWAGGQVVGAWNDELYLAIFDKKFNSQTDPAEIATSRPAFLLLSLDAKLWHGHWPIVGNVLSNLKTYPQPNYKVRVNGVFHIESRDRSRSRPASAEELDSLQYRTVSSAALVEDAVRAYFGLSEWNASYDEMLAEYAVLTSKML